MNPCLEGLARELLERVGLEAPIDALDLAEALGLQVAYASASHSAIFGRTILVPARARVSQLHWLAAHEIGHFVAREAGEDDACDVVANYLAGALLLPRAQFERDLRRGWDLRALMGRHPYAPAHAIAVRVVQLREASTAVYDQGRLRRRWGRPLERERELVTSALETGDAVRIDDLTGAWPVFDGAHRRVIILGASPSAADAGCAA